MSDLDDFAGVDVSVVDAEPMGFAELQRVAAEYYHQLVEQIKRDKHSCVTILVCCSGTMVTVSSVMPAELVALQLHRVVRQMLDDATPDDKEPVH